ncbi:C40 family peptidase [Amantichitinum ursilacus]|uniref:Murein DD-endopeptidase MepH n=1 Tax=Amantichitinum ursilacus TaxID=857265 RepID=A0A0N0XJ37_9NEIS|nr:C40 family peptidase [Amantichitinum ursilacus]KPC52939.1 Murein DD-endopeptidase MepH precursor [Amantichitinum ursilacus]
MTRSAAPAWLYVTPLLLLLAACGSAPHKTSTASAPPPKPIDRTTSTITVNSDDRREVVLYALSLLDVNYQFGGANPEAGMDCSGLVYFIYKNALGINLPHNAAEMARLSKPVDTRALEAGDLVFFNTLNKPYSHVGIYIGDGKFVHAPSSKSHIKVESLKSPWFAARFEGGRTLIAGR